MLYSRLKRTEIQTTAANIMNRNTIVLPTSLALPAISFVSSVTRSITRSMALLMASDINTLKDTINKINLVKKDTSRM